MIRYKIDILAALKAAGYTTYKLRVDNILGEATITKLRNSDTNISLASLDKICELLKMQPADLIEEVAP